MSYPPIVPCPECGRGWRFQYQRCVCRGPFEWLKDQPSSGGDPIEYSPGNATPTIPAGTTDHEQQETT